LWEQDSARRARYLSNLSRYEGRASVSLSPESGAVSVATAVNQTNLLVDADDPQTWLRINVSRSLVRAVTSKIAAVQQPKVVFVTSGADWSTRRKSRLMDQFVEAEFARRSEPYSDVWDLGAMVFRDCVIFGDGFIKTLSDVDMGCVARERCLPWEILVDPEESQYGTPTSIWHTYRAHRRQLQAWYPELKVQLEGAPSDTLSDSGSYHAGSNGEMLRCWEYWRQPDGPEAPGRHVLVVAGVETALIDDELTGEIPISHQRWDANVRGYWSTSLLDEARPAEDEFNLTLCRMARSMRATSMGICFLPRTANCKEDVLDSEDTLVVEYDGQVPPTYESPAPWSPAHTQYLEMFKTAIYETTGVNQMSATGVKQSGADSGTAIKTLVDMQSEIFATAWRNYQLLYVDLARKALAAGRELAKADKGWSVNWAGDGFLRTIPWAKVDLAEDQYTLQIQTAPSGKGTAFERVKTGEELYGAGMISRDAMLAIKQYYDTPGEADRALRQRRVVEQWTERWLDATPEQIESGLFAEGDPLVPQPIRWMDLEDAIVQVADGYMQATLDGAPEENRMLFLTWLETADAALVEKQRRLAEAQQPPPQQPPAPTGPNGMPPPMPEGVAA